MLVCLCHIHQKVMIPPHKRALGVHDRPSSLQMEVNPNEWECGFIMSYKVSMRVNVPAHQRASISVPTGASCNFHFPLNSMVSSPHLLFPSCAIKAEGRGQRGRADML